MAHAGVVADATPVAVVLNGAMEGILSIAGTIGIIAVVLSGISYLFAAKSGNEQLQSIAKKMMLATVTGIVLVMGAMIIVHVIAKMFL